MHSKCILGFLNCSHYWVQICVVICYSTFPLNAVHEIAGPNTHTLQSCRTRRVKFSARRGIKYSRKDSKCNLGGEGVNGSMILVSHGIQRKLPVWHQMRRLFDIHLPTFIHPVVSASVGKKIYDNYLVFALIFMLLNEHHITQSVSHIQISYI